MTARWSTSRKDSERGSSLLDEETDHFNYEHDPEKREPVFGKIMLKQKKLDHDPIQSDRIMV